MRVLLHACVRNEADRYWDSWLNWYTSIFGAENIHVFDDQSDDKDETVGMAIDAGVNVSSDEHAPSFMEHEGGFRQAAWWKFEERMQPEPGDWVFCIDADEFLVSREDEQQTLYRQCEWANSQRRGVLTVQIPEVFHTDLDEDDGKLSNLQVRVDGFWNRIVGCRLFAYQRGGKFSDKAMGSGSEPSYVLTAPRSSLQGMWLLHFGYARPEDVKAKYERYSGKTDNGHARQHIESIVQKPQLVPWDGPYIDVHYGPRPAPGPGKPMEIPLTPIAQTQEE